MRSASWNVGEMRAAKSLQSKEDLRCAHSLTYGPAGSVSAEETLAALDAVRETKMAAEMERITQMYLQPDAQFPGLAWDPENNSQRDGLVDSAPAKEGADFPSPCMDWPLYSSDGQLSEDVQDAIMQGPLVLTHFRGCAFGPYPSHNLHFSAHQCSCPCTSASDHAPRSSQPAAQVFAVT